MGRRVERTRAGGTWTEAKFWGFIRGKLRQGMRTWPVKHQVRVAARRRRMGVKRVMYEYPCEECKGWFPDKQIEVDHIVPAGSLKKFTDLPQFVERLYCEADGLQLLCKPCHQLKTNREREERKNK